MCRYTEQELRDIFYDALDFFNEALDSGITRDNTVLAFFTPDNGTDVYEQFCRNILDGLIGQPQPTALYLGEGRLCQLLQVSTGGHLPMLLIMGADHAEHDLG